MTVYVLVSDCCVWEFPTAIGVSPLDLLTDVIETPGDVALFDSPNEHGVVAAGRSRSGLAWVVVPFELQGGERLTERTWADAGGLSSFGVPSAKPHARPGGEPDVILAGTDLINCLDVLGPIGIRSAEHVDDGYRGREN